MAAWRPSIWMARKIILNVDPGIDDAVALCMALGDPSLEVVAITATGGTVSPEQSTSNVQAIVEQLDPSRWPRLGTAASDQMLRADGRHLFGADGMCGAHFAVAKRHHQQPDLAHLIHHLIMIGGTLGGPGNVTAAAEFNIYCDAEAARNVFHSPV